jgi:hypothetical protein
MMSIVACPPTRMSSFDLPPRDAPTQVPRQTMSKLDRPTRRRDFWILRPEQRSRAGDDSVGSRPMRASQTRGLGARQLSHCQRAALKVCFCKCSPISTHAAVLGWAMQPHNPAFVDGTGFVADRHRGHMVVAPRQFSRIHSTTCRTCSASTQARASSQPVGLGSARPAPGIVRHSRSAVTRPAALASPLRTEHCPDRRPRRSSPPTRSRSRRRPREPGLPCGARYAGQRAAQGPATS